MTALRLLTFPIEKTLQVRAHRGEPRLHFPTPISELGPDYDGDQLDLGTYKGITFRRYIVDDVPDDSIELSATLAKGRGTVTLDIRAGESTVALGLPDGQLVEIDSAYLGAIRHVLRADVIRLGQQHAPLDTPSLAQSVATWYELSEEAPQRELGFASWAALAPTERVRIIHAQAGE